MAEQKVFHQMRKLLGRLSILLAHRYFPIVLVVLAIVIMTPALKVGWVIDDLLHRPLLLDSTRLNDDFIQLYSMPTESGQLSFAINNLYSFVRPEVNLNKHRNQGFIPWWTNEKLRLSFWRPITSFTLWLDYQLFPDSASLMHAHSILWFAAVVFLVAMLYRRLIGPVWIAALAGLLYALDENYYLPVMLMAARNVLLALVFGILAFFAHRRWRRDNSSSALAGALCCFALSLLSSEAGITTLIYIFAYALVLDNGTWRKRALSLTPYLIVVVLWRIIYNILGHGTYGNEYYLDPVREPLHYMLAVFQRGPILLLGQLGGIPSIIFYYLSDSAKIVGWLVAVGFITFIVIIFLPLLRKNRMARFWFLGMVLSVLPICAVSLMNRNLFFVGIGAMALVAQFIGGLFSKESWIPNLRLWRVPAWALCIALLVIHIGVAGIARVIMPGIVHTAIKNTEKALETGLLPGLNTQDLVLINTPLPVGFTGEYYLRSVQGQPLPKTVRALSLGLSPTEVIRTGQKTLILRAGSGSLLSLDHQQKTYFLHSAYYLEHINSLFHSDRHPMCIGDGLKLPRMSIEITGVDDRGRPTEALFKFAVSLDDPSLCWLKWDWRKGSFSPFTIPAIGERAEIAGPFQ
jgi:hypothetical protein